MDCRIKSGNDDMKNRSRDAFFASELCQAIPKNVRQSPIPSDFTGGGTGSITIMLCVTNERRKGSGTPADVYPLPAAPCGRGRAPNDQRARLSAFHHGACQRDYSSQRLSPGQASRNAAPKSAGFPAAPARL
jgi:hypothetical protein